ncbi:hypothetical protein [Kitasatospora sp. NPDC002040]|uniref:hypothetical protein n=1 Tax=Kitasatospora sp. NPDC002040 TaxID=3154661 RepID=UPI003329DAA1
MVVHACPPRWRRTAARYALLAPGTAIALLAPLATPGNAADGTPVPPPPVAQALDGEQPLASTREVTSQCATAGACSFRMYDRAPREFSSGVLSVGNAAINCTDGDMVIDRTVTFVTSSTDNIGGEISGRAAIEGGVDTTVTASATGTLTPGMTNSVTQYGPNKDKGPTTQDLASNALTAPVTVAGSNALHLGAKATFELAFKASFARSWQAQSTESTKVTFTVSAGDEIQFGLVNAMSRTAGELKVNDTGKLIKNVTVDSPSSVTASSIVAQTFAARDRCLSLRPPGRALGDGPVELAPERSGRAPDAVYVLTASGTWERM